MVRLGGRRFEQSNPSLDVLLAIVDETGRLAEAKKGSEMSGSAEDDAKPTTG